MHITEFYKNKEFVLSFEIAPPRNGEDIDKVYKCVEKIMEFNPSFITVTQGSGGSLRGGTAAIASTIKRKFGVEVVSHITCLDKSNKMIENELITNHYLGIENIMALRGDPPWGDKKFIPVKDGFSYASEFVEEIQRKNNGKYILRHNDWKFFKLEQDAKYRLGEKTNFCVGIAGYPEGHRECKDEIKNIEFQKLKVDTGSDIIFSQILYDSKHYFKFVKDCKEKQISVPIIPGIMPITFNGQINFITETCGVKLI